MLTKGDPRIPVLVAVIVLGVALYLLGFKGFAGLVVIFLVTFAARLTYLIIKDRRGQV